MDVNVPEGDIEYKSTPLPLKDAYYQVYNKKEKLEEKGFVCDWWFEIVDRYTSWLIGNTSVQRTGDRTDILLPAILKNLDDETLMLLPSYKRGEGKVTISGNIGIRSDGTKYKQVLGALEAFKGVTGIELVVNTNP